MPAVGAACLAISAFAAAPPAVSAATPSASAISSPDDSHPIPSYRPGPKGNNVPPPAESKEKVPAYYSSCDQVRAEGKFPLYRGQPGYAYLDPDGDGVACDY
jgi:hypothetical protein